MAAGALKKILVGIDGSEESLHAATVGADLAGRFSAEVLLVSVVPPTILPNPADPDVILPWNLIAVQKAETAFAEKGLAEAARRTQRPGLSLTARVEHGAPAETLARIATDVGADLVVVGKRGRGLVSSVLLGSVSARLSHICEKPLLIVR